MEPTEINRSALIATVKQPFLDWLRAVDSTSKNINLSEINCEPTVYLVPEFEAEGEFAEWLGQNYKTIFEEQLAGWWTDRSSWPTIRSIEVFQDWFECRIYSMVFDLDDGPL